MNCNVVAVAVALLFCVPSLMAGWGTPCETTMTVQADYAKITSIARCSYQSLGTQDNSVTIRIRHEVTPGGTEQIDICEAQGYCGTTVFVFPYSASTTYTSTGTITATQMGVQFDQRVVTFTETTPAPQRPRDDVPDVCESHPWRCDPDYREYCPLIIQTGSGPWHFTSVDGGVLFDMNADGRVERTAWTSAGSSLAFLALDLNGNGRIDDARELFGEYSLLPDGGAADNGFAALRRYDANGDTVIDQEDGIWESLLVWHDVNHDGRSQGSELQPLAATGFRAIETRYHELGRRDPNGNVLRFQALIQHVSWGARPYYDVFLNTRPQ